MFERVTIVGVGLIGGSLGLALKSRYPGLRIAGVDSPGVLAAAVRRRAVDEGRGTLASGVADADLVVLARTVDGILADLDALGECLHRSVPVTDVGSTKAEICRRAWGRPGRRWRFHGGHPMAGSERRGIEAATAGLFRGRPYLLCPEPETPGPETGLLRDLLEGIGARVRILDPERHDRIAAAVSHLPQLVALGLASVVGERSVADPDAADLAGPAFREMIRVAGSEYRIWESICRTNQKEIGAAVDRMVETLVEMTGRLRDPSLEEFFRTGRRVREACGPPGTGED